MFKDPEETGKGFHKILVDRITAHRGEEPYIVSMSGGSTPNHFFNLLTDDKYRLEIDKPFVHFIWVDERNVPADHPDSNYGSALKKGLKSLQNAHLHPVKVAKKIIPGQVADNYEREITALFSQKKHPFPDFALLGIGTDGHTASLFPETEALNVIDQYFTENWVEKLDAWRYTQTFELLSKTKEIYLMATGGKKAPVINSLNKLYATLQNNLPIFTMFNMRPDINLLLDTDCAKNLEV